MKHTSGRIDALLVCGGKWHDFDFARLELLKLLAEDERVRVQVASDYRDVDGLSAGDLLVTYTCDVRPDLQQQEALRAWVEAGGHWLALHGTNNAIDPPPELGQGPFTTPRAFPLFADTLGSQFLSHPTIEPYTVTVSPGAGEDPLVAGIGAFEVKDELYLCEYHGQLEPLLETRWTGTTRGFAEASWPDDEPRLVMYRRPLGEGCVLYLTLGHCRGHYDMVAPPHRGSWWPTVDRWAWERPEFYELLRRGLRWGPRELPPAGADDAGVEAGQVQPAVEAGVLDLEAAVLHDGRARRRGPSRPRRRGAARAGTTASRRRRRWPRRPRPADRRPGGTRRRDRGPGQLGQRG